MQGNPLPYCTDVRERLNRPHSVSLLPLGHMSQLTIIFIIKTVFFFSGFRIPSPQSHIGSRVLWNLSHWKLLASGSRINPFSFFTFGTPFWIILEMTGSKLYGTASMVCLGLRSQGTFPVLSVYNTISLTSCLITLLHLIK